MRKIIAVLGGLFLITGAYQSSKYVLDYEIITQYGKGYVWGSVVLLLIGAGMLVVALRRTPRR